MKQFQDKLRTIYRKGVQQLCSRQSPDRVALVLRLENTELLADCLGQAGFAHLLVQMSIRMTKVVRPHDPVQIAAPGIFTVTLRTRSEVEAMRIARRLQENCQSSFSAGGLSVTPVLTGVLVQNTGTQHAQTTALTACGRAILDCAGPDMLGQIILTAYDPYQEGARMVATVSDAVAAGQIEAYFQPQLCCDTGNVMGFEALARWNHSRRGLLSPAAFMAGMCDADHAALTQDMLRQALKALNTWQAAGHYVPTVSVNISQPELSDRGFADMVLWELDRQNIAPSRLVLEVLESVGPINSCDRARANLARLAEAGCQLDLDDFGTGYASLDSIRHFGVHRIKIDRSFVTDCPDDADQQRMILAILALAEKLGVATLAEGVETAEEHSFLAQIGCDQVQGYAIGRPMPVPACIEFLQDHVSSQPQLPKMLGRKAG